MTTATKKKKKATKKVEEQPEERAYRNDHNLPEPLFNALTKSRYVNKAKGISVTSLIKGPRERILTKRHEGEIITEATDRLWSVFGTAVHNVVQEFSDRAEGFSEERLEAEIEYLPGKRAFINGQPDWVYPEGDSLVVADYKVSSVFGFLLSKDNGFVKPEWEAQLNCYAFLYRENGFAVQSLEVVGIMRDWSRGQLEKARKYGNDYPSAPIGVYKARLWTPEEVLAYLQERVRIHVESEGMPDDGLPECSKDERWERGESWAVMKKGRKTAVKLHQDSEMAEHHAKEVGGYVEHRLGRSIKCESYCDAAPFCDFYLSHVKDG